MIKKSGEVIKKAILEIAKYYNGEKAPLKSRYEHFNENLLGGLYSGSVVTIGAISGVGKTYLLQQLEEDFLDKTINPNADVVLLRANWEMSVRALLLRRLSRATKKSISSILRNKPNDVDKAQYRKIAATEASKDVFYMSEPCTPEDFFKTVDAFLQEHKDRQHIVITIDHIALVLSMLGQTKMSMDMLLTKINILKNRYDNASFIILSQLNREIESRTKVIEAAPRRSDFYATDTIFHLSDGVIVIHAPENLNLDRYMMVDTSKYNYLSEHFSNENAKRSNFLTEGRMFWHYLKMREREGVVSDIQIEYLNK